VVGRDIFNLVNNHSGSTKKFSETEIINMLKFFIENTFAMLSGRVFQQTVGIPMRTKMNSSRCRLHTRASQEKRKEASPIL
jgi:hypothetical protein